MSSSLFVHPRDELVSIMHRMHSRSHWTTSRGTNASIKDREGVVWMTPSYCGDVLLKRDDVAYKEPNSDMWSGNYPPEWPFHTKIYDIRPDIGAVLHVRSHTMVAFGVAKELPNPYALSQAAFLCGGTVGLAEYFMPGTQELADAILRQIANHDCVVVANLGVVVVGRTMAEAYQKFEALEFCARAEVRARVLGGERLTLTPQDVQAQLDASSDILCASKKQQPRPPITTHEMDLRASLVKYVRRSYEQGLIHSASGAMSARLSERSFLVTPTDVDRHLIQPSDIVLVEFLPTSKGDGVTFHGDNKPSRAWAIHSAMYQAYPETNAIMHAHPFHITAFCMSSTEFTSSVIPESYIVLRATGRIGFRESLDKQSVVKAFQKKREIPCNVVLVDNDGVIVRGSSLEKVFDRLEVLEATANVILDCKSIAGGAEMRLMTKEQTDEIDEKWFGNGNHKAKKQKLSPKYDYGQW